MIRSARWVAIITVFMAACAHEPSKPGERADLVRDARATLARMETQDPGLRRLLGQSVGYIVFPKVGAGGFIVGGGAGAGVIFENGQQTGFATVESLSAGALAGGQQYAQLVIVRDPAALDQIRHGRFGFGANASAVILRSGASETAAFDKGVAVVVEPLRGAMVNASLTGQRIRQTL